MKGSDRVNAISESETLALTKKVRALQAEGKDVLGLTLGEPDFNTPVHIANAGIQAIRDGFTKYPPVAGIPELREAIVAKFKRDNGIQLKAENIVVSTGAKQSVFNVIMALVNPGEEVILPVPYWVSYREMLKMAGAEIVEVKTDFASRFKMSAAQLEAAITPKTKLLIFNSPGNPTGTTYSKEETEALVEVLERHPHVFVLSDEIYEYIEYEIEHVSPGSYESIADRVVTINGFSKGFAMTGWRLGYMGAPKWIAQLCELYQGQITSGANTIAQKAGVAALNGGLEASHAMRDEFLKRRNILYKELCTIPDIRVYKPSGAFYFYPDFSAYFGKTSPKGMKIKGIEDFCEYLLMEGLLAVIPGTAFGTQEHVRISYAYSPEMLKEAVVRLQDSLHRLK